MKIIFYLILTISLNANFIESKEGDFVLEKKQIYFINKKIEELKSKEDIEKLKEVNKIFNTLISYGTDKKIWNKKNYIATIKETISVGLKGDCDDYVMAKLESLLYLGFKEENMKLLHTTENGERHVKLLVSLNDKYYILDSLNKNFRTLNINETKDKKATIYNSQQYLMLKEKKEAIKVASF